MLLLLETFLAIVSIVAAQEGSGTAGSSCYDVEHGCKWWVSFCREPVFHKFMNQNCRQSCNLCHTSPHLDSNAELQRRQQQEDELRRQHEERRREEERRRLEYNNQQQQQQQQRPPYPDQSPHGRNMTVVEIVRPFDSTDQFQPCDASPTGDSDSIVKDINEFGWNFYRALTNATDFEGENFAFSPLLIGFFLKFLHFGSIGSTHDEIGKIVFPFSESANIAKFSILFKDSLSSLQHGQVPLMASAVAFDQAVKVKDSIREEAGGCLYNSIINVPFGTDPEAARREMNALISGKTHGQVQQIFSDDRSFPADVSYFVPFNAAVFSGIWKYEFNRDRTRMANFKLADKSEIQAALMTLRHTRSIPLKYHFDHSTNSIVLGLPYGSDDSLSMWIVMPTEIASLPVLERQLSAERLKEMVESAEEADFSSVLLPKFVVQSTVDLKDTLAALGFAETFTDYPSFSVAQEEDLYIGLARHFCSIKVTEEGVQAAPPAGSMPEIDYSTIVTEEMEESNGQQPEETVTPKDLRFVVDHPFLFMIRHNPSGMNLFLGRVMNPTDINY